MRFETAARLLDGIPYTSPAKGRMFYDLVLKERPKRVLELGFAHGVSTCYFAAAAQELGNCTITAVDIDASRRFDPPIETLLQRLGVADLVSVHRELSSYTWFLKKEIVAQTRNHVCTPKYDLVFVDGPKDWTNDGCAFFLADKLLNSGGLILFDDYRWSYTADFVGRGKKHDEGYVFKQMSDEEFDEPHIKAIFDLLITQHPDYGELEIVDDQLALARKVRSSGMKTLLVNSRYSIKHRTVAVLRRLAKHALGAVPSSR